MNADETDLRGNLDLRSVSDEAETNLTTDEHGLHGLIPEFVFHQGT
jgi:hypothetical protein